MKNTALIAVDKETSLVSARRINEAHRVAIDIASQAMVAGIERAIEVGRLLAEEKENHKHGEWIPWIEANLEFDKRQAQNYLRAYESRDRIKAHPVALLDGGLKGALRLLAKPREKSEPTDDKEGKRSKPEPDVDDPEQYRIAYLIRAEQAVEFADMTIPLLREFYELKPRRKKDHKELIDWARRAADAWTKLANQLEQE